MTTVYSISGVSQTRLQYSSLPDLPDQNGQPNPGVAGAFAGVSHNVLIVAGGANFPNGFPWQGGTKVWQSAVYLLVREGDSYRWQPTRFMDRARAYGASVVWNEQLICVGGNDSRQRFAHVFSLTWHPATARLSQEWLPALPIPLANPAAAVSGHTLYVFGGESDQGTEKTLYALDLEATATGWQTLGNLPGSARAYTALVAQLNGADPSLYVLGGRQTTHGVTTVYPDAYEYRIGQKTWQRLPDMPQPLAAHQAIGIGTKSILILGGDDGTRLRQIETLANRARDTPAGVEKDKLTAERNHLQSHHPGFVKTVWQLDTATKNWFVVDTLPFQTPVTTPLVQWGSSIIIPSGEITPGVRTPAIRKVN